VIEKVCLEFQVTFLDLRQQNNKQDFLSFDCLLLGNSLTNRLTAEETRRGFLKRCNSNDACFSVVRLLDSIEKKKIDSSSQGNRKRKKES
jgi:hypothetical protein